MQKCPHCAEKISPAARICKHCKRGCVYEIELSERLNDKDAYTLAKYFLEKPSARFFPASLRDAKIAFEKAPLILADNLSFDEKQSLQNQFSEIPLNYRLQIEKPEEDVAGRTWAQFFYAAIALVVFAAGSYYLWTDKTKEETASQTSVSPIVEIPETAIVTPPPEASAPSYSGKERSVRELTREDMLRLLDATVFIRGPQSLGSGVLISSEGYILSNSHVTSKMSEPLVILRDGRQFRAQKIKQDSKLDLSLLKISAGPMPYLKMGDANDLYPGQSILTIGNPSGLSFTVTQGIVSFVGREINGVKYVQTDAAINPGNSGGPMITTDLRVVGINTLTAKVEKGISFALPINYAYTSGGVAEGLGDYPLNAKSFQPSSPSYQTASLPQNDGPGVLPDDLYQKEAEGYRTQLEKEEAALMSKADQLKAEIESLQSDYASATSDLSKRGRLRDQIEEKVNRYNELPPQIDELRVRYYRQIISLLHRQKGDSRYSHLSNEIERQINELQAAKKKLEQSLSP